VASPAQRGDTGPTSTVLADIRSFLNHIAPSSAPSIEGQNSESAPLFLMGHSMGGGEVLLLSLLRSQPHPIPRIAGLLLESPYIALHPSAQPGTIKVIAGKLASKLLPKRQLEQKLDSKNLCRDPQVRRDWEIDELCHNFGTLEGFDGILQRAADLTAITNGHTVPGTGLKTILGSREPGADSVPVWIGHGTEDLVTSCPSSQTMFNKLEVTDKTLKLYEGAYHKLHAEPDGVAEEFANDVAAWILERTNTGRQGGDANEMRPKL
jgi:acylglycerol lipase